MLVHVYGVNSLAGVDFQQFLKIKMATTANFLLIENFDDVRLIKGKVMNISSPNVLYGYKVAYAWLVLIFNNIWKTRWPPQPIFCWLRILTTSDQLKQKLWIYHHQTFDMDIRWHKLGWYWFSAIFKKRDGRHSQFSTNIYTFIIDSSASCPVTMLGDSFAVVGNRRFLVMA